MMKEHINLFQPDLLEGAAKARTPRKRQWAVASVGIFLILFILFYIQEEKKQILLKREVDAILQQRQQLEQQMAALAPGTLPRGERSSLTEEMILKERIAWSRVLVEVSRVVPEGVWITGFENNAGEGVRFDGFAVSYQKVTDLMASLETSRMFQDVLLDFSRQNTERKVDFSINTRLKKVDPEIQLGKR